MWSLWPAAQGMKATHAVATSTSGVYTLAKRVTSVSMGDCAPAACSTRRAMAATVLASASAVVLTCEGLEFRV